MTTYGSWFITGLDSGLSKRRPAFIRTNADVSLLKQLGKRNVSLLTQPGKRNLVTKYNQINMPCILKYVQVFAYVCNILQDFLSMVDSCPRLNCLKNLCWSRCLKAPDFIYQNLPVQIVQVIHPTFLFFKVCISRQILNIVIVNVRGNNTIVLAMCYANHTCGWFRCTFVTDYVAMAHCITLDIMNNCVENVSHSGCFMCSMSPWLVFLFLVNKWYLTCHTMW